MRTCNLQIIVTGTYNTRTLTDKALVLIRAFHNLQVRYKTARDLVFLCRSDQALTRYAEDRSYDGRAMHLLGARPVSGLAADTARRELHLALDFLAALHAAQPAGGLAGRLRAVAERTIMYHSLYK